MLIVPVVKDNIDRAIKAFRYKLKRCIVQTPR